MVIYHNEQLRRKTVLCSLRFKIIKKRYGKNYLSFVKNVCYSQKLRLHKINWIQVVYIDMQIAFITKSDFNWIGRQ